MRKTKLPIIVSAILVFVFWFVNAIIPLRLYAWDINHLIWEYNTQISLVWLSVLSLVFFLKVEKRCILNAYLIKPISWILLLHIFLNLIHYIKVPAFIFAGIAVLIVMYWIKIKLFKKGLLSGRKKITTLLISFLVLSFSWVWFIPVNLGIKDDIPFCKFRFQVLVYDSHDYGGHGNLQDFFFRKTPNKYGTRVFYEKIGGWQEYFGLKQTYFPSRQEYFNKKKWKNR